MLPGSPGHEIWARDFTGGCGLFSFVFRGKDGKARDAFIDALGLFGIGYSWGGYESLAVPVNLDDRTLPQAYAGPVIRLQIGLEDVADLRADLEAGFRALG